MHVSTRYISYLCPSLWFDLWYSVLYGATLNMRASLSAQLPGKSDYSQRTPEQIRPTAASQKCIRTTACLWKQHKAAQVFLGELPGSQKSEICSRIIEGTVEWYGMSEIILTFKYTTQDTEIKRRATWRYPEMKARAGRSIFQLLPLLVSGFCSPLSQPSVVNVCVHWGLQLAHQTHSSQGSTLPFQSPFPASRSLGPSKETGNL